MAKIIVVANQKGGVGKTTTPVNLAAALGAMGRKVLLADIDPQGNATSGFGLDKSELKNNIYQVIIDDLPIREAIYKTPYHVDVLPAKIELAGAEVELVPVMSRELKLKRALADIENEYDFIFIDCPPSLGLLTLNALAAAKSVLLPIQCEYYALEGVSQLTNTIELVRRNINPTLSFEGILMTMYDARTRLSEQVVAEVRQAFGDKVYEIVIPRSVKLSEAPSYGQPISYYEPNSRGTEVYKKLAKEVIKNGDKKTRRSGQRFGGAVRRKS